MNAATKKLADQAWKRQHTYTKNGRQSIKLDGLVDIAHDEQLQAVDSQVIQIPSEANGYTAIVRVSVTTARGTFAAHGESSPDRDTVLNSKTGEMETNPPVAMAESRALARALATATNNGQSVTPDEPARDDPATTEEKPEPSGTPPTKITKPAAQVHPAPKPGAQRPATAQQKLTIHKLALELGEETRPLPDDMSYEHASDLISDYNASLQAAKHAPAAAR